MNNVSSQRASKLNEVQKYFFAAYDLQLFLDTHPHDAEALKMYSEIVKKAKNAKKDFECEFGPLDSFSASNFSVDEWKWNANPWPWDNIDE